MKLPFTLRVFLCALSLLAAGDLRAEKLIVVTTIPDLADFTRQVGGNHVDVSSIASGAEDPHGVQIRPSLIVKLAKADLFIQMGLELEHAYAPAILAESRNRKIQPGGPAFLDTSEWITPIDVRHGPLVDRSEGHVHPLGNPHYNLDPVMGKAMVSAIAKKLASIDPANQKEYESRAAAYLKKLDAHIQDWKSRIKTSRHRKGFVSYHDHWGYFIRRFEVVHVGTIEPKPGIEPGPRHLEALIQKIRATGAKLILKESFYGDRLPAHIAKETGARVATVPIMVGGTPGADSYIKMIDQIVKSFVE
jgi:zinc/manganese transport system substrate-binding protein